MLVFKYMKDYYCFIDADSSESSLLYHFPRLLSILPELPTLPEEDPPHLTPHYSNPTTRWSGFSLSPQTPTNVHGHPHSATPFHMSTLSPAPQALLEPTFSIKLSPGLDLNLSPTD